MNSLRIFLILFFLSGLHATAQTPFLDSIARPDYVAWEYQLDEVVVKDDQEDIYNTALRYFKSDAMSSSDEVMEKLSGIWAIKRGAYALEPVLRGLSAGQVNITIDGMRMLGACTDKMDPVTSYVEPNNLKELNTQLGASGSETGSTVGGSFDMKIKKPSINTENPRTSSFGTRILSANKGLEALFNSSFFDKKKFALRVSATYRKGEDYRAGGGDVIKHTAYNKVNYSVSATLLQKLDGQLNFSYIGDYAWDVGYPALIMDVGSARAHIAGLTYDKAVHGKYFSQISGKIYYNQVNHVMDDTHRDAMMHMDMPGNTQTLGAFVSGLYTMSDKLSGELKVDFYSSVAHAEMTMYPDESASMFMLTWPDIHRSVAGFHNKTSWNINKSTSFFAGIRVEANRAMMQSELGKRQFSVFNYGTPTGGKVVVNANAGLDYRFHKNFDIRASVALGERMPNESEQFGFYLYSVYDGYDYVGRTILNTEKSTQGECTLTYKHGNLDIGITGYYYHFSRYIMGITDPKLSPMTPGAKGVKVYENLSYAHLAGSESQISFKLRHFEILNIAKVAFGKTIGNDPLPLIPPFKNLLNLAWHPKGYWLLSTEIEASTPQNRINAAFGESATPAYWIANFRVEKTFKTKLNIIKVSAAVDNIFDTYYCEHLDWGDIPRMGRNIQISVFFSF